MFQGRLVLVLLVHLHPTTTHSRVLGPTSTLEQFTRTPSRTGSHAPSASTGSSSESISGEAILISTYDEWFQLLQGSPVGLWWQVHASHPQHRARQGVQDQQGWRGGSSIFLPTIWKLMQCVSGADERAWRGAQADLYEVHFPVASSRDQSSRTQRQDCGISGGHFF